MEYVDPLDTGERFVIEYLSGSLWNSTHFRWAIVDRNTSELMRRMKDNQPHNKGHFIWRADKVQAEWWCERLNAAVRPQHIDAGTGPDMQAHSVDIGVVIGEAVRRRRSPSAGQPPVFVRCEGCSRCHRPGACPVS